MNEATIFKTIFCLIALQFVMSVAAAGPGDEIYGIITGSVITADGKPASEVTVRIRGTSRVTLTDEEGTFVFHRLVPGDYTIEISFVGYETMVKRVTVKDNKQADLFIQLRLSQKQLQEVVVTSRKTRLVKPSSDYAAKLPLKNLENPQVYTTITRALVDEQLLFSADDALRNAPGIQKMWDATARSGDGGAYYNSRGFILQSKLRNGVAGNITSRIDAANLESIEVIKGPSATLFGSSLTSYGGLINRITKKPYSDFGGEAVYASGSYGFNRISLDINTPMDSAKALLLRMNAAYNYEGSFQDNGFEKGYALAPSVIYQVNDRLSFSFDAELYGGSNTSRQIIFFYYPASQLNAVNPKQLGIDYKRAYSDPSIFQIYRSSSFFAQMKYKLSDSWTSQTNFSSSNSFSDGPYAYFYVVPNAVATGDPGATGADYLQRSDQSTANNTDDLVEIQQNFTADFRIGKSRNRFVGGLDFFTENSNQLFYGADFDLVKKNGDIPQYSNFNRDNLNALLQDTGRVWKSPYDYRNSTYSAYISDVWNITERLIALAAVRLDKLDNKGNLDKTTGSYSGGYQQTSLSPKFGLVYQPVRDKISLFANYQNGFANQSGSDVHGKTFRPEQANQIETGIKISTWGGQLTGTFSYYDIRVKDVIRPDQTHPNFSIQDGTQLSKGVEAEVIANPVSGLSIVSGFAYNDSKLEKADPDVEGRRPATAMSPITANLWMSYKLMHGKAQGLGFGFGGNYASGNKILNSVYYGVFTLPEYTVLNATVFYEKAKYRIGLKIDNLTNQEYWIGYTTMNPQKLRSITGSISFRF